MSGAQTAVLLFVRAPSLEAKDVGLPRRERVQLLRSMLGHTLSVIGAARAAFDLVVAHDGLGALPEEAALCFEQRGATFGDRLLHAVATTREAGYRRVVMLGTDTPTLTPRDVELAVRAGADEAVAGPSEDGGFYLLSLPTDAAAKVLGALPWRTGGLLTALTAALKQAGLRTRLLLARQDVDAAHDVAVLSGVLDPLYWQHVGAHLATRPSAAHRDVRMPAALCLLSSVSAQGPPAR